MFLGSFWADQLAPPLFERNATAPPAVVLLVPTASQTEVEGQAMLTRSAASEAAAAGSVALAHVVPPFVVLNTAAPPTPAQTEVLRQATACGARLGGTVVAFSHFAPLSFVWTMYALVMVATQTGSVAHAIESTISSLKGWVAVYQSVWLAQLVPPLVVRSTP